MSEGKPMKAWAGFKDGKIHLVRCHGDVGPEYLAPMLFTSKRAARYNYSDVRQVEIREVKQTPQPSTDCVKG